MMSLLQSLFSFNSRKDLEEKQEEVAITPTETTITKPSKYSGDIESLKEKYGSLEGRTIEIELQELTMIAPRNRKRIEAYQGLRTELKNNYGCELIIYSRKTKKEN